ncbi:hypothetical protein [Sinorhizobium meliloti]|uniref:hypothetical protein n=1 Tax=Rhizobium meliloti TaxID=382 RepID=UPI000FD9E849|nr:hypothetical protein [Sinorhizobium meliloti]RVP95280.1 hypothetical protein CN070_28355 [Sinorhizobium meliloti]
MRERDDFVPPEQRASTGLPLSVMLLSMLTIILYLIVGGVISNNGSGVVAVYVPQQTDAEHP